MQRRGPLFALAIVLLAFLGWVFWYSLSHHPHPVSEAGVDASLPSPLQPPPSSTQARAEAPVAGDGGVAVTVRDRARRDAVREAIARLWRAELGAGERGADAGAVRDDGGPYAPMPTRDGGVDPEYLRARIREDFVPMAQACYEQLLARRPGVGGRVVMAFTIVGDSRVGGVVEEAGVEFGDGGVSDAGIGEDGFATCLRESMLAMAFAPPPGAGQLRVRYPVVLRAGDAGE